MLQVDFASLRGKHHQGGDDVDADLRGLFREAEMSDAVLFFDECEALFRTRDHGGADRLLRAMLQEIEKCKGLVFLATNRPAEPMKRCTGASDSRGICAPRRLRAQGHLGGSGGEGQGRHR